MAKINYRYKCTPLCSGDCPEVDKMEDSPAKRKQTGNKVNFEWVLLEVSGCS